MVAIRYDARFQHLLISSRFPDARTMGLARSVSRLSSKSVLRSRNPKSRATPSLEHDHLSLKSRMQEEIYPPTTGMKLPSLLKRLSSAYIQPV
jgi:hypothetical protein